MRKLIVTLLIMAVIIPAAAFAEGAQEGAEAKEVNLVYANWEEGVAWTHFLATVLEDEFGYEVNLTAADVAPAISSVAAGDQDYFMEGWLPTLHSVYTEGTDIVRVSKIYDKGITGLIVPKYMADDGVTKVSDLAKPEVVEKLNGEITGIDAGAGMMIKTAEELIPAYGLEEAGLELVASSSPAMMAAIDAAYQEEEYIVGMGWQPHSMFGRYDLVILEQDGEQIFVPDDIFILGRPGVEEDLPVVSAFFDNVYWTNETIGPLMVHIADSELDTLEAAREWKNENPDVWQDWIPEM
ncbi:glycine betaine ABC transporter substrate-binding protein [Salinispira pacifica]|uniref:Glycine betaine ABC transport system, glycine betaine-binding protein OpuAC n=1 Tax=Salinispira pacifica TaxID=1307761 RepID=V5WMA8_9SPIO|nr:glycine betaine ABC transporter substrate-binding protein [Salinispira pacifica]AHC16765.1 Glycine betaine ABC transport system, glycine betaine-binding protein OpuAC [Salinispira pacifica]